MASIDHTAFGAFDPSRWNKLARLPTQRYCWARACFETVNRRDHERLVTCGDAFAPFLTKHEEPRRLAFIGDPIGEPYDVLSNEDTIDELAESIVKTGLVLDLRRVPADAPIIKALQRAYRGRGSVVVIPRRASCPYIALDETWREPEQHFSARWRSTFRRMRRKAESIGQVTFEIIAPDPNQVRALLNEVITVEAASWMKAAGIAMAVSRWRLRFYRRYARYAAHEGILRLCFLRIDGKPVAMEFAVESDRRLFVHKIAYDEAFESCSPGSLLRLEALRYAAERGLRSYEFQGKDTDWTYFWTKTVRSMVWLKAYPLTARGLWMRSHDTMRAGTRRAGKWTARLKGRLRKGIELASGRQAGQTPPEN